MSFTPSLSRTPSERPSSRAAKRRVLVLDDDAAICRMTALFLERAGYAVDTGNDGERGWEALCTKNYDLLVTDNEMPHMTGLQLIVRLRLAGFTLPIIVASGSIEFAETPGSMSTELAGILRKPYDFGELIETAHRVAPLMPGTLGDSACPRASVALPPSSSTLSARLAPSSKGEKQPITH